LEDFKEKARVLKDGSFLVECIPNESETNFDYLYAMKKMAEEAGFQYYAKIPWIKGNFVSNTGRCSKNSEDLMIFSKGKPRALRLDAKKTKALGVETFMSGTNKMLPTDFNVQAVSNKDRICQSEKPSELFEQLLEYITLENEIVLDQFAGSGSVGVACIKKKRKCILIEKAKECVDKIVRRIGMEKVVVIDEVAC
jgi:site-specific DNA-methyltransferase (adenine-specific)